VALGPRDNICKGLRYTVSWSLLQPSTLVTEQLAQYGRCLWRKRKSYWLLSQHVTPNMIAVDVGNAICSSFNARVGWCQACWLLGDHLIYRIALLKACKALFMIRGIAPQSPFVSALITYKWICLWESQLESRHLPFLFNHLGFWTFRYLSWD
jgi:hypothetical protein